MKKLLLLLSVVLVATVGLSLTMIPSAFAAPADSAPTLQLAGAPDQATSPTGIPTTWGRIKGMYHPDVGANGRIQKPGAQTESFPSYCFQLNVPFVCQYSGSADMAVTKNCGEACAVMLGGYFNHGMVSYQEILNEDRWLASRFADNRYLQLGGYYTNFSGRNELGTLLREYHGLHYALGCATADGLVNLVRQGYPCIVGVRISSGNLIPGSYGTYNHWALVIGWSNGIVLNDPGTRYSPKWYSVSDFTASWASSGNLYTAIWK